MQDQKPHRNIPQGAIIAVSALMLAVGAGTAFWAINTRQDPSPSPAPTAQASPDPGEQPVTPVQETVQVYWIRDTGSSFQLTPKPVAVQSGVQDESDRLATAFNHLLSEPDSPADTSAIPPGTQLRGVEVRNDGVYVNLSQEFTQGGGSASMSGRVWQVVYTATATAPNRPVWILVEGQPIEYLGGEGLTLDQPLTRASVERDFPI
ncbi:GerMN domain-containing protein [Geitlerinema splendidum]|nr:GerMN domain-containing protein [Geitlerinema splendidum]